LTDSDSDDAVLPDGLPEGWALSSIGQLYENWGGATPSKSQPKYWNGDIAWLSSKDIKTRYIESGDEFVTKTALQETRLRLCPIGTVVLVVRSGILAHLLPVAQTTAEVVINQDLKAFYCKEPKLNDWLAFALRAQAIEILSQNRKDGTTVQSIMFDGLKKRPLPIPPLPEQRRIVAKVEALLGRVNKVRERLDRVPDLLKQFRRSVLAAACSGGLTADWREGHADIEPATTAIARARVKNINVKTRRDVPEHVEPTEEIADLELPETWALESTAVLLRSNVLFDVKDGNHGANHPKKGEFSEHGVPFITAAQVRDYKVDYEGAPKVAGKPLERLRVGFAKIGDAILTHKGTIGRAALNTSECVLTPQTTYYRCNDELLDAKWLVYFFTSLHFFRQCAAVMSQTTRDFVPISEQYRLFLVVPPLGEQIEIVRRVEHLLKLESSIIARHERASKRVERMTPSTLAKALAGELVETEADLARREGREYEPASVLLQRLAAGPSAATSPVRLERGRAVLDILLLLEAWNQPVSISALEPALVLMRNDAARQVLLGGYTTRRRRRSLSNDSRFVRGLDVIYSGLEANGAIRRIGQSGFELANSRLLAQANAADRAKAAEVLQAVQTLSDLRNLSQVVASIAHEHYEITV
jgi:type I restriction enzyme, S subunit